MFPHLFEIPLFGGIPINTYGFMIMVGFLLASYVAVRRGKSIGINPDLLLDVGIIAMIFGILGAKINYLLQYPSDIQSTGQSIWNLTDWGFHPLGALLGTLPYFFWWSRTKSVPRITLFHWKNYMLFGFTLLFAFIGARAVHLYLHSAEYDWAVYKSWQSGFVLYGGLLAGLPASILYVKMRGEKVWRCADVSAPSVMLGVALGRLGCFLNGCCFGRICELPWAIRYPKAPVADDPNRFSPAFGYQLQEGQVNMTDTESLPVHPTQLYETIALLAFFFILSWAWKRRKTEGLVFLLMCVLYGGWRFFLEFLRADPGREAGGLFGLTYSQTVSLLVFLICFFWMLIRWSRGGQEPLAKESAPLQPPPEARPKE